MGKKKASKKGGGDDFWDEAGEEANGAADDSPVAPAKKGTFAAMTLDDGEDKASASTPAPVEDDDDDQFGGLMGALKKSGKKDKKGKKGKKQQDDDIWDELGEDVAGNAAGKADQMDVDGGVEKAAPVKAGAADEHVDEEESANKKTTVAAGGGGEEEDNPHRVLTKKEKEKLKKEREKAKKKAEADAKKAAAEAEGGAADSAAEKKKEEEKTMPAAENEKEDGGDEGDDGDETTAADKKKKKKKKKAADTKEAPAAGTKKPSAALQALQARLAAQKKAEEEARAAEEEARKREEELERQEKEEEERKEAERQRKKEKEKAKKEQLRREGKLLTPKQKAEKAAAEARMQAMIKAGNVKIDGLMNRQNAQDGEAKEKKRVVYDSRKKKKGPSGPPSKIDVPPSSTAEVEPAKEEPVEEEAAPADAVPKAEAEPATEDAAPAEEDDVKDEWDAQSDDGVKDDWDAESEEEEEEKPAKASNGKASAAAATAPAAAKTDKAAVSAPKGGKAAAEESSSEEDESDSDDDDDSDEESSSEEEMSVAQQMAAKKKAEAEQRRKDKHEAALAATSKDNLRSPICCIMGHVDTGKTKLLDKIRQTNVQEGEAGGITQQIGATYFPVDVLRQKIAPIDPEGKQAINTPGLLVIDTPGHESFTNLRTRGSSLCNIAILVVDIMHGLEQQTLESIRMLRDRKTPFIVALNKIDRLYGWKSTPDGAFRASLAKQDRATQTEFRDRYEKTVVAFAEQGLNAVLYYENKNFAKNVSLVPTSAHTGEGIPDMLQLLINLTQDRMSEKLMYLSELECTVLEVKVIEGLGTTIDVILSNGVMYEGDKIVLCGLNGPIVTQVRALLTPQPLKEMRVKGSYVHNKMVKAALGVKISAPDLEKAISGSRLLVCGPDDDEEELKEEVMSDLTGLLHSIDKSGKGVCVQASTLGSLEALLEFLKQSKIPVNGINIGPVYKRDVMRCATMLEKNPDLAVMLCFDVTIDKEAEKLAEDLGVKIFSARIIYHLFDAFVLHQKQVRERKQKENRGVAVWPCRLKILAVFAKRSPLILGCEVLQGDLRLDTPIAVKNKSTGEIINLGRVTSLEVNHKRMEVVTPNSAGAGVAVRIECAAHEAPRSYGRHFTDDDELFSHISRQSIDSLKEYFWDSMSIDQKKTIKALKVVLGIA